MRERVQTLGGIGDADRGQKLDGACTPLSPPEAEVEAQHFLDLEAD